jgi:hypothetical protein
MGIAASQQSSVRSAIDRASESMKPSIAMQLLLLIATCFTVGRSSTLADEKAPVATDSQVDRATVERLITELRSPNRDPNPKRESGSIRFPPDYDSQAQKRVEAARQELIDMGKDAFPIFIEHVEDEGYSMSIYTSILSSRTVGGVCADIIDHQIDPVGMRYKTRTGSDGKWHGFNGPPSIDYASHKSRREAYRAWWLANKDRSLCGIQQAAVRWHIKREQEIGFPDPDDREHYLVPLTKMLDELMLR